MFGHLLVAGYRIGYSPVTRFLEWNGNTVLGAFVNVLDFQVWMCVILHLSRIGESTDRRIQRYSSISETEGRGSPPI